MDNEFSLCVSRDRNFPLCLLHIAVCGSRVTRAPPAMAWHNKQSWGYDERPKGKGKGFGKYYERNVPYQFPQGQQRPMYGPQAMELAQTVAVGQRLLQLQQSQPGLLELISPGQVPPFAGAMPQAGAPAQPAHLFPPVPPVIVPPANVAGSQPSTPGQMS